MIEYFVGHRQGKFAIANPEAFKSAAKRLAKGLMEHPVTGQGLPTYGTNVLVNILNEAGGLPTKNFRTGRFDRADKISGETMHDVIVSRGSKPTHGCHAGCVTTSVLTRLKQQ